MADVSDAPRRLGRYLLLEELGAGATAEVHLGQLEGPSGFSRLVAVKCLRPHLTRDRDVIAMLFDEARLAATVRHPNVVGILDVLSDTDPVALVMEYVHGVSLAQLTRAARARGVAVPLPVASALLVDLLEGLHAAHEAHGPGGAPLCIVHRDVSPQNVMVGRDGVARVLDFGIAKAAGRSSVTDDGVVKGKAGYMAPEQVRGRPLDRRADVFAAGVVAWELLTGDRFVDAPNPMAAMLQILERRPRPPSSIRADVPAALDAVVLRALARAADERFSTAREAALALEAAVAPAAKRDVAAWLADVAGDELAARSRIEATAASRATELATTISRGRRARTWRMAAAAAVLSATAAVTAAAAVRATRPREPAPSAPSAPSAPAAPSLAAVVSPAVVTAAVPASGAPAPAETTPAVAVTPTSGAPRPTRPRAAPRAAKPASPAKPDPCAPPYTVRDDGVHVPKPECFR